MIRWIFLLLLLGLMKILGGLGLAEAEALGFHASMAFGFLILSGYLAGEAAQRVHLPRITGYLLAGVLCGPDLLAVLDQRIVHYLKTIDQVALFYIALTAGGELDWRSVRPQLRRILSLGGAQLVPGWLLVLGVFLLASGQLEFLAVLSWQAKLAACAILAIISVAVSPATTVAVIVETRARGPLRDLALGTTVLMDVVVIIAFTLVLSQSGAVLGAGHEAGGILHECFILGLSILLGTGVGFLLRLFLHSGEKARKRGLGPAAACAGTLPGARLRRHAFGRTHPCRCRWLCCAQHIVSRRALSWSTGASQSTDLSGLLRPGRCRAGPASAAFIVAFGLAVCVGALAGQVRQRQQRCLAIAAAASGAQPRLDELSWAGGSQSGLCCPCGC